MNKIATKINYLLRNTPQQIRSRAKKLSPELVRERNNRWVYKVGDYLIRIKIPKLKVKIKKTLTDKQLDQQHKIKNRDILVSCTCDFWRWNGPDYNAMQDNYSERTFSDLSEPHERDPQRINLICKHVYSVLKQFKRDYKEAE